MVEKCCFYFDLTMGYLTFSILILEGKVCTLTFMHYFSYMVQTPEYLASAGLLIGYTMFSGVCLFLSIKGIIQKRSILMVPYTVVLISEAVATGITYLIGAIVVHPTMLLGIALSNGIQAYILVHHMSLYKMYKQVECLNIQTNGDHNGPL